MVYRDLKPKNVAVYKYNKKVCAKIIDIDYTTTIDKNKKYLGNLFNYVFGTPFYMNPV